jgi:F0F1-type ATP synthase membrane subunit b/b'
MSADAVREVVSLRLARVTDEIAWEQARRRDAQKMMRSAEARLAEFKTEAQQLRAFLDPPWKALL